MPDGFNNDRLKNVIEFRFYKITESNANAPNARVLNASVGCDIQLRILSVDHPIEARIALSRDDTLETAVCHCAGPSVHVYSELARKLESLGKGPLDIQALCNTFCDLRVCGFFGFRQQIPDTQRLACP